MCIPAYDNSDLMHTSVLQCCRETEGAAKSSNIISSEKQEQYHKLTPEEHESHSTRESLRQHQVRGKQNYYDRCGLQLLLLKLHGPFFCTTIAIILVLFNVTFILLFSMETALLQTINANLIQGALLSQTLNKECTIAVIYNSQA